MFPPSEYRGAGVAFQRRQPIQSGIKGVPHLMACEHFLGGVYPLCLVVHGLMTPALREIRTYCTSDQPSRCPIFRQYAATHEKLPLEAAAALMEATPFESLHALDQSAPSKGAGKRGVSAPPAKR